VQNLVSLSHFHSDLSNDHLPNFSFLVPNLLDDGHDGPLQVADAWLRLNITPLISSSTFQKDGLLIIVFDEANTNDSAHGGGHVAALIISPKAKQGYRSTTLYQHQNTLRLILHGLGGPLTQVPQAPLQRWANSSKRALRHRSTSLLVRRAKLLCSLTPQLAVG
jgi:phosphatidylinositol-3-phosphatase